MLQSRTTMPALQVISSRPLAGKSAIAAGLARAFANDTVSVRLLRAGNDEAASQDAIVFADLLFASSPARPLAATDPFDQPNVTSVVEAPAAQTLARLPGVLVVRGAPEASDVDLARALGDRLLGTIATRVPLGEVGAVARELTDSGLRPLAVLPEDRVLAAPSVDEIRSALDAGLVYDGENATEIVEEIVIGPVYADPARPHFQRYASKAILAPFNKTDLLLAAIETQAACLVITGGHDPSPYVADRAQGEETTVLLAPKETPETVASLAYVWLTSRFRGQRKADAIYALMEPRLDFAALRRKLP